MSSPAETDTRRADTDAGAAPAGLSEDPGVFKKAPGGRRLDHRWAPDRLGESPSRGNRSPGPLLPGPSSQVFPDWEDTRAGEVPPRRSMQRTHSLSERLEKAGVAGSVPERSRSLGNVAGGGRRNKDKYCGDVVEDLIGDELLFKPLGNPSPRRELAGSPPGASGVEACTPLEERGGSPLVGDSSPSNSLKQLLSSQIENAASFLPRAPADQGALGSQPTNWVTTVYTAGSTHSCSSGSVTESETRLLSHSQRRESAEETGSGHEPQDTVWLLQDMLAQRQKEITQLREFRRSVFPQEKKALEEQVRGRESERDQLAFNPTAPPILQRQIADLKSHINDLQEANENAVHELARADEEISQMKSEMAKMKFEYEDRLQDALQKLASTRTHTSVQHWRTSDRQPRQPSCHGDSLDPGGEVFRLRCESRKLRETNHGLSEENRWLKEELWDMRRQHEQLLRTIMGGEKDTRERGVQHRLEHSTGLKGGLSTVTGQPARPTDLPSPPQRRKGGVKWESMNGRGEGQILSWEARERRQPRDSSSPASLDSDSTDFLLAGFNRNSSSSRQVAFKEVLQRQIADRSDGALQPPLSRHGPAVPGVQPAGDWHTGSSYPPQRRARADTDAEHRRPGATSDDSDAQSDDDMCSISQTNTHLQSSLACKTVASSLANGHSTADWDRPALGSQGRSRAQQGAPVLPRRPFAPRGVADLKVGHLVKFSRPGGRISQGTVRYVGNLPGRQDVYLGVELEGGEVGRHNGTFEGVRYYLCKPDKGVFVSFSKVIMAWE
nr:PREDICTED: uncharacterized protein LOC107079474 isoform X1 [Lepisosteus oculatus]XP_015219493.1 PREDICTED: uncharacterized protein LOC107079474 isoform X1 [Lepisosteus oculatus]XP_015219494.1 PREDICTED: uncharacterized protein LOC107079474 isoform X1 [Lepisosteus oculatus]